MTEFDVTSLDRGYGGRFQGFQDLMHYRVHDILLVSSLYDSFILEEDGRLEEGLINQYIDLNLVHMPRLVRASSGKKALDLAVGTKRFDLIIATMHLGDMHALEFVRQVREAQLGTPVVLLTYDYKELQDVVARHGVQDFDRVFLWQGDFRILLAIVKSIEDQLNVEDDTRLVGVQSIILVEDSVRFYSTYLPLIYAELMRHSQDVISEGVNLSHRILRMRARPKILLCESYEDAWAYFDKYHENILGVISDIEFPRFGEKDPRAGVAFAKAVRERHPDVPILLQSQNPANCALAEELGVSFLLKGSQLLLQELRGFMQDHLSFGDFVFKRLDGTDVAHAHDLRSLEKCLQTIPPESLLFHAERNHFSNWLKARTEFWLAHQLRPRRVSDYESAEEMRQDLIRRLREFRLRQHRGEVVDFHPQSFDSTASFARIGGGSLGGKGRGLAFISNLVDTYNLAKKFGGVEINVPPAVVIGTDVFDQFMEDNNLRDFAITSEDDTDIEWRFLMADMPETVVENLRSFLELIRYPLAVRSSSLLEDSQHQPFAGIYSTHMLPNNRGTVQARLEDLLTAIKLVYASTFFNRAKTYMKAIPYRLEEEKMAIVIQRLVGSLHGNRFYPDFSGVARSHNFYPSPPLTSDDGIASVALGLGLKVVEGGSVVRFSPNYPRHLIQFSNVEDTLEYSQKDFYAMELADNREPGAGSGAFKLGSFDLPDAEVDGTLGPLASTYSIENDAIYEGLSRKGPRVVTFAPILKNDLFPLPGILRMMLSIGKQSMSSAVEMEFAVNLSVAPETPKEFAILQMRPMVVNQEWEEVSLDDVNDDDIFCESSTVLGHGVINDIHDIVFVDVSSFDRALTREVAGEIGLFNYELAYEGRPYILVGLGRWGSSDPWLGIPVKWEQIAGAKVIIEASFRDMRVQPSQGSHFFQNLATMEVGYFTIDSDETGSVDWDWLLKQRALKKRKYARRLQFSEDLVVKMDGHLGRGCVLRPGFGHNEIQES